ncbi:hypothetical protein KC325_g192 [Hortaea werneckii]|nr:hypothetical protein KC325_g192 [Hortaea werneckii]
MRLKQHLASHLRSQLGTWQSTDSWEVKSEVDRRHGEETALAVHHSVVMREGEGPSTSKSMTCDESYSWQWKVDDCGQQWEESFRVSIWIPVRFIKFKTLIRWLINLASLPLVITAPSLSGPTVFLTVLNVRMSFWQYSLFRRFSGALRMIAEARSNAGLFKDRAPSKVAIHHFINSTLFLVGYLRPEIPASIGLLDMIRVIAWARITIWCTVWTEGPA